MSHLQNYYRYTGTKLSHLAVDKLKSMWRLHEELLWDTRQDKDPGDEGKFDKVSNFKIGQVVLIKNHTTSTFQPKYLADHRVIKIVNDSTVIVASPDSKEKKCNIHHVKAIFPTTAFEEFQKSIAKEKQKHNMAKETHYNFLRSQSKEGK